MQFNSFEDFVASKESMGMVWWKGGWETYFKQNHGVYDSIFSSSNTATAYGDSSLIALSFMRDGKQEILYPADFYPFVEEHAFALVRDKADFLWDEDFNCYEDTWDSFLLPQTLGYIHQEFSEKTDSAKRMLFFAHNMFEKPVEEILSDNMRHTLHIAIWSGGDRKCKFVNLLDLLLPTILEQDPYKREAMEAQFLVTLSNLREEQVDTFYYRIRLYVEALRKAKYRHAFGPHEDQQYCEIVKNAVKKSLEQDPGKDSFKVFFQNGDSYVRFSPTSVDFHINDYGVINGAETQVYSWEEIKEIKNGNRIIWRKNNGV